MKRFFSKFSNSACIEFDDDEILVCTVNKPHNTGQQILFSVFDKVEFWINSAGYDYLVD